METDKLETKIRHQDHIALIDLSGEIDSFAEDELNRAYAQADTEDPTTIVFNFSEIDYINSTGIALIVGLLAKARQAKREIIAYGLSDHYKEIFEITRLSDFMQIVADESSALAAA